MPIRVALNVAYAMLCEGLDPNQRRALDEQIYGWGALNDQGNQLLRMPAAGDENTSGGES